MIKSGLYALALILVGVEISKRYPRIPQPSAFIRGKRASADAAVKAAQAAAKQANNQVAEIQDELEKQRQSIQKRMNETTLEASQA